MDLYHIAMIVWIRHNIIFESEAVVKDGRHTDLLMTIYTAYFKISPRARHYKRYSKRTFCGAFPKTYFTTLSGTSKKQIKQKH